MQYSINMEKIVTKNGNNVELRLPKDNDFDILVIGVVHGEEPQGKFLIDRYLNINPETRLAFIPALNPDGMALGQRVNANLVDLNRNFPTANWALTEKNEFWGGNAPASELETRFVVDIIEKYSPKLILTLHAPFKIVNYDGPAKYYAERISELVGYPVQADIGYATPGSFGTYAGIEKGIPTITLELDEECDKEALIEPVFKVFNYLESLIL